MGMSVLASRRAIVRAAIRKEQPPAGDAFKRRTLRDGTVRTCRWEPLNANEKAAIARSFVVPANAARREFDAKRRAEYLRRHPGPFSALARA